MPKKHKAPPPKIDPNLAQRLRARLLTWYQNNKRDLPWRRNPAPYAVTVSEFMCQQTQIVTVLPYFDRWMKSFPDWTSLAQASEDDVLKHWEGLGYYRRARALHQLARTIVERHQGEMPDDIEAIRKLPGIGPYTAGAISSIAFHKPEPLVDGNVERVFSRLFNLHVNFSEPAHQKTLWEIAHLLVPETDAGDHNQAIMELGATLCTPRKPQCLICPLQSDCQAETPENLPVKQRPTITKESETIAIITKDEEVLLLLPGHGKRWKQMHQLPLLDPAFMERGQELATLTYGITRFRVTAHAVAAQLLAPQPESMTWIPPEELSKISLPAPHRKILRAIGLL